MRVSSDSVEGDSSSGDWGLGDSDRDSGVLTMPFCSKGSVMGQSAMWPSVLAVQR